MTNVLTKCTVKTNRKLSNKYSYYCRQTSTERTGPNACGSTFRYRFNTNSHSYTGVTWGSWNSGVSECSRTGSPCDLHTRGRGNWRRGVSGYRTRRSEYLSGFSPSYEPRSSYVFIWRNGTLRSYRWTWTTNCTRDRGSFTFGESSFGYYPLPWYTCKSLYRLVHPSPSYTLTLICFRHRRVKQKTEIQRIKSGNVRTTKKTMREITDNILIQRLFYGQSIYRV